MSHHPSSGHPVSRVLDLVYLACIWIAGACIFFMSLFIPWGIFSRYVLGTGAQWPEPISILLMVVFTFLGAACSYRAGGHIAVEMVTQRLPSSVQRPLRGVVHLLMLAVSLVQIICSVIAVWFSARNAMGFGRDLRAAIFHRVGTFSAREVQQFGAPSLITRTTNDVQQVQMLVVMSCLIAVSSPIMMVGGVVMAIHENAGLAWLWQRSAW